MERLCKDCKHYDGFAHCDALDGKPNPIHGGDIKGGIEVGLMRIKFCGWSDPRFWEPKPKP